MDRPVMIVALTEIKPRLERKGAFGRYLCTCLPDYFTPFAFVMNYQLAVQDLNLGVSHFPGKAKLPAELVGRKPNYYRFMRTDMVTFARSIFHPMFLAEIRRVTDEIYHDLLPSK